MFKILWILVIATALTIAAEISDDNNNEVDTKPPASLDPVLRKALLKAITDLEKEQVNPTDPAADITDVTTEVNEILEPGDQENENESESSTKSIVNYHSFIVNEPNVLQTDSEVVSSDVKENDLSEDQVELRSEDFETRETASPVIFQSRSNQKEIFAEERKPTSKKPIINIVKSISQSKQNVPTTSTTPRPIYNEDGENIEQLEDVQVFQAPLVAAFTVHQDINGLPKKVVPIYKQALRAPIEPLSFRGQQIVQNQQQILQNEQQILQNQPQVLQNQPQDLQNQQQGLQNQQQVLQNQQQVFQNQQQVFQNQQVIQNQQQQSQNVNSQQLLSVRQESQDQKQVESIQQQLNLQQQLEQKQRLLEQQLRELQQQQRQHEELLRQQQYFQQQNQASFEEQLRIKQQQFLQQQSQIHQQNLIRVQEPLRQQPGLSTTSVSFQPSISLQSSQSLQQLPGSVELQPPHREPSDFLNSFRSQSVGQLPIPDVSPLAPSPHQQPPFERPLPISFNNFNQQSVLASQQLPIEKSFANRFNPAQQGLPFQQQLPNDKPFLNFNTIQPSSTRVFRHDSSSSGNFGLNPNNIFSPIFAATGFLPQNNYNFRSQQPKIRVDDQLKNLLIQSGLTGNGKSQEDLSIVSKVLSLNHGIAPGGKVVSENIQFVFGHGKKHDAPTRSRIF